MEKFKLLIHKKALKELNELPAKDKRQILDAIFMLEADPFKGDVKPIKGLKGVLRLRVGDYRIAFTINFKENEIAILKIAKRKRFFFLRRF